MRPPVKGAPQARVKHCSGKAGLDLACPRRLGISPVGNWRARRLHSLSFLPRRVTSQTLVVSWSKNGRGWLRRQTMGLAVTPKSPHAVDHLDVRSRLNPLVELDSRFGWPGRDFDDRIVGWGISRGNEDDPLLSPISGPGIPGTAGMNMSGGHDDGEHQQSQKMLLHHLSPRSCFASMLSILGAALRRVPTQGNSRTWSLRTGILSKISGMRLILTFTTGTEVRAAVSRLCELTGYQTADPAELKIPSLPGLRLRTHPTTPPVADGSTRAAKGIET